VNGYVWVNPNTGKPYHDIKKAWNRLRTKAGLGDFHFHDLRHTFGTRLGEVVNVHDLRELMGHSSLRMTMKYTHALDDRKRKAVKTVLAPNRTPVEPKDDSNSSQVTENNQVSGA
jgi:integrase